MAVAICGIRKKAREGIAKANVVGQVLSVCGRPSEGHVSLAILAVLAIFAYEAIVLSIVGMAKLDIVRLRRNVPKIVAVSVIGLIIALNARP